MSRLALLSVFVTLVLPVPAQMFPGPPASVTSPTADGRLHGVPASVLSPTSPQFLPGQRHVVIGSGRPLRPFGTPRHRQIFVPVPLFYPIYGAGYDNAYPSVADPSVDQSADPAPAQNANDSDVAGSEDALRRAYIQGAHDALAQQQADSRYGQHYLDSRESARSKPQPTASKPDPAPADDAPSAVFIFKDGHQIETRNFAIMGQTLYDFSGSSLRKLQLTDLDAAATVKANDDRGITVKLQ